MADPARRCSNDTPLLCLHTSKQAKAVRSGERNEPNTKWSLDPGQVRGFRRERADRGSIERARSSCVAADAELLHALA